MAVQTETPTTTPSVEVVGNAFVEQYYHILHQSPELVYKFYQDVSVVSRPDPYGVMTTVTTMQAKVARLQIKYQDSATKLQQGQVQGRSTEERLFIHGINKKICSLDYTNYKAEIKTADAQESYKDGVTVLVTGCLTGKDNVQRKFTQSFFLAPQDKGYFVYNDVFRYVDESKPLEISNVTVEGVDDIQSTSLIPEADPSLVVDTPIPDQATFHAEEVQNVEEEAHKNLENENIVPVPEDHRSENHVSGVTESFSAPQEDAPKMSYASIVSSQTKKGISGHTKVYVPANATKVTPSKTVKQPTSSVAQPPGREATAPLSPENSDGQDEGDGHSIYVRNLPFNATVSQLEEQFKKFGPIRERGVQVRSNKGFFFGFVEFQDLSSMQNAIQAAPVIIGGMEAAVEIKRTTTRVGSGRGRFPPGRGLFRNDSFRGRGSFSGGRGYGRSDYGGRGEYSGRGRGPGGRSGGSFHQQGRGRGGGPGGRGGTPNQNVMAA